jgi:hypothetical protein
LPVSEYFLAFAVFSPRITDWYRNGVSRKHNASAPDGKKTPPCSVKKLMETTNNAENKKTRTAGARN